MTTTEIAGSPKRLWWMTLLKGVLFIVLGIWMLKMPKESFETLAFMIGLIVVISGLLEVVLSYVLRKQQHEWGWNISGGILDIIVGIFLMIKPMTILVLITLFISFWLVLLSVLVIRRSIKLKQLAQRTWVWNLILGIAILILAVALIWHPQVVGLTMMFWLAISFISLGAFRIIIAFQANNISGRQPG